MVFNLQYNSTQHKEPRGILCQISISEIRQSSYPIVSLNWASNLSRTSDPRSSWIMHGNSITCPISPQQRGLGLYCSCQHNYESHHPRHLKTCLALNYAGINAKRLVLKRSTLDWLRVIAGVTPELRHTHRGVYSMWKTRSFHLTFLNPPSHGIQYIQSMS